MIKIDADAFGAQLDAAFEKKVATPAKESIRIAVREVYAKLATEAGYGSSYGSPVLFANFINNHNVKVNSIDDSFSPIVRTPPGKQRPNKKLKGEAEAELLSVNLGDKVFISNSVPYAARLEYEGHSRKTPRGIYRVTTAVVKMTIEGKMKTAFKAK